MLRILLALTMLLSTGAMSSAEGIDYTTGTPWLDSDLDGNVTADTPVELKDDFALYVNKDKILATRIPEGYAETGTIEEINRKLTEDTKNMFLGEAPKEHDAKLAYDLFWLMMDWDGRNALGIAPLKAAVDEIEAIDSIDALNAYLLEKPVEDQLSALFAAQQLSDFMDSSRNLLTVATITPLLEDSAEYIEMTDFGRIKKDAVTELARKMLRKLGYSEEETQKKIDNCFAFETTLAPTIASNEDQKKPDFLAKIYNIYSYDELKVLEDKLPVLELAAHCGFPKTDKYMVTSPGYLQKLNELYTEENLPMIRDYMIVGGALGSARTLDRECYEWSVARDNAVYGSSGMLPDEDAFAPNVAGKLVWPVARLYSETYLRQEDKDRISSLVDEIIEAYHGVINNADFLSDETKAKAIEKLEAMGKEVLYPDDWSKYACDELNFASKDEGGTLWEAEKRIASFSIAQSVREFSEPIDNSRWVMPPNTVNCMYYKVTNTMFIFGAFCQGELYRSDMSDEELYGKLGWVIGHEISHAFDSSGSQFDKDGNMSNWWTEEDYKAFLARNQKMVDYYNNMHPWKGQNFYGSIMTGEAGADMGGMRVMLRIAATKENFDYDTFFRSLADVWFTKQSLQMAYLQINNEHPMGYLRVNATLQQFDEFLNFYGITEGDGMYLAPEDRVAIW